MRKVIIILIFSVLGSMWAFSQEGARFTVQVSTDSVLFGNYFEVKFTLENAEGENFEAPEFPGFNIVGGPNMASSFSMVNGEVSQSVSYTYYLEPVDVGNYYIHPASIFVDERVLETDPIEVLVAPNPDGVKQEIKPQQSRDFGLWFDDFDLFPKERKGEKSAPPAKKPGKKRKTYKL